MIKHSTLCDTTDPYVMKLLLGASISVLDIPDRTLRCLSFSRLLYHGEQLRRLSLQLEGLGILAQALGWISVEVVLKLWPFGDDHPFSRTTDLRPAKQDFFGLIS
jgi:hypothetical protein